MSAPKKVIIVGSGIFGTSTALWMLKTGGYEVTILDKSGVLPAPDAASTDLNKIIRNGDYADPDIAALNMDAVNEWRKPEWEGTYHESGVLMLADENTPGSLYVQSSYQNVTNLSIPSHHLPTPPQIHSTFPTHLHPFLAPFTGKTGYINHAAGWAEAGRAVEVGLRRVVEMGGVVRGGVEVVGVVEEEGVVMGVKLEGGEVVEGDLFVIACGAWTPSLFTSPTLPPLPQTTATGQCIAKLQLTPSELARYADVPVMFDMATGFYVFPPTSDGVMKIAIHGAGYLNPSPASSGVSTPRTILTPGAEEGMIPREMVSALRDGLKAIYPELGEKDFVATRLCWYLDTVDGDWLIDWVPGWEGRVLLATAGCGHAFKFFPNIGREILAKSNNTLSPILAHKWRFSGRTGERDAGKDSDVRTEGERKVLRVEELAGWGDLKGLVV